jgi:hypothetical protein
MSRLCCHDNTDDEKKGSDDDWSISEEEIRKVIEESTVDDNKKPSTTDLFQRIEELEFELECLRADNELQEKRRNALQRLLAVIDLNRFDEKNKAYVKAIVKKIKQLVVLR